MSINRRMDKQIVVKSYNGIYCNSRKRKGELLILSTTRMNLKTTLLSESSQTLKRYGPYNTSDRNSKWTKVIWWQKTDRSSPCALSWPQDTLVSIHPGTVCPGLLVASYTLCLCTVRGWRSFKHIPMPKLMIVLTLHLPGDALPLLLFLQDLVLAPLTSTSHSFPSPLPTSSFSELQ